MLRVIFDTSVYGRLVKEPNIDKLTIQIRENPNFMVKGFEVIRKELRKIPKDITFEDKKLRILILNLYEGITTGKPIYISENIKKLARKYFELYKKYKGSFKWKEMENDFLIVACASIHGLDILFSDDKKTMLNKTSIKAYQEINAFERYRTPDFFSYEELKTKFFKKYES